MSAPKMPNVNFSCTQIARLLADKITPDFNFKKQLWFIARANPQEASEYLCLLLRIQFDFQPKDDGESFFHNCFTDRRGASHEPFGTVDLPQCAKEIAQRALILRDARQRLQNDPSPFKFLQLPYDIRLQVYGYAFINNQIFEVDCYFKKPITSGRNWAYDLGLQASKGIFGKDINTALLFTNHQIFNEAEPIVHQIRFLKIGPHLDHGLDVLRRLSPRARRDIRAVDMALPLLHWRGGRQRIGFHDNLKAWCKLCDYMSQNLRLRALSFRLFAEPVPANFSDAAWVEYLIKIRGLKHLQPNIQFLGLFEPMDLYPGSDPGSQKELNARRQALINYLKSEMC